MSAPAARWYALADAGARAAYADLWAASAQSTPFHSLAFADAACDAFGYAGHLVLTPGSAPEGGLVVYERRLGPLRAAALPPYGQFVSPLLRAPSDPSTVHRRASPLDAIAAALMSRLHQAALRLDPWLADARPLAWAGWTLRQAYHMEAPLQGADGRGAWNRSARRRVQRSSEEYTIEAGAVGVAEAVRFAEASHAAKGLGHPPRDATERLARGLVDAGLAEAFVARDGAGRPEAALVLAWHRARAHYWIVGSVPGPALTVLLADAVRAAMGRGITSVHFGGANTPSVAQFKRGFGSELVPVVRARWVGPRWLRAVDALRPG